MAVKIKAHRGAWWLFVDYAGKRKARRVGVGRAGKRAADTAAAQIAAKLALGDLSPLEDAVAPKPVIAPPTFAILATEWLERYPLVRGIGPNTRANYASFTRNHLIPYFGDRRVNQITPGLVEDFIAAKLTPGGSRRYAEKALGRASLRVGLIALRLILQRAVQAGHLASNPVAGLGRFQRQDEAGADPFTTAELRAILSAAQRLNPDFGVLLRLWAQTGMRAGEVCGLQRHDLDAERGTAVARRSLTNGRLGPTKTRQARTVSLLHPILDDGVEWRPGSTTGSRAVLDALKGLRVRSLLPEAPLFLRGHGPWPSWALHLEWRRVLTAASVRYREPEQLRHTFASTMLSRNAPLLYVQKQGGWRSAAVLLRVYSRWLPPDIDGGSMQPSATPAQPDAVAAAVATRK